MVASEIVEKIKSEKGNRGYNYFFSVEDPETVLLIDKREDETAFDEHHKSPMM